MPQGREIFDLRDEKVKEWHKNGIIVSEDDLVYIGITAKVYVTKDKSPVSVSKISDEPNGIAIRINNIDNIFDWDRFWCKVRELKKSGFGST